MDAERIKILAALADKPLVRLPLESEQTLKFINTQVVYLLADAESLATCQRLNVAPTRAAIIDYCLTLETRSTIIALRAHVAEASIGRLFLGLN